MNKYQLANGSGLSAYKFDREKKFISIDFSGNIPKNYSFFEGRDDCIRNDASILFFSANSYRVCFELVSKEIKDEFDKTNGSSKRIEKLILPYYFSFRHFIELELKAIIATLSGCSPSTTHKLDPLIEESIQLLNEYKYKDKNMEIDEEHFEAHKKEASEMLQNLRKQIKEYTSKEPSEDYYRYIFETEGKGKERHIVLKNNTISLDYNVIDEQLKSVIHNCFELCRLLS